MKKERVFKSNASKLLCFVDRLAEFKETGKMRPISLNIGLTNACNNNCPFCGYADRDKSLYIPLDKAKQITKWYADQGALAVEIIGGGDPTMYPWLEEYVDYCEEQMLSIGMITNGRKLLGYSQEFLSKFTWIRASVNWLIERWYGEQYEEYPTFEMPENVTFSFTYIWNEKSGPEEHDRIEKLMAANPHAVAMKVQPDVLTKEVFDIAPFSNPKIFINEKIETARSEKCYMQLIKPQVEADGCIYRCSCGALSKDGKMLEYRQVGTIDNPPSLEADDFDTSRCHLCFYSFYNDIFKTIEEGLLHEAFV